MRTDLVEVLLDRELEVSGLAELASRGVTLWRDSTDLFVQFEVGRDGRPGLFRVACASFDAQPPSLTMVDPGTRKEIPLPAWAPGVSHSAPPTFGRPILCMQGVLG